MKIIILVTTAFLAALSTAGFIAVLSTVGFLTVLSAAAAADLPRKEAPPDGGGSDRQVSRWQVSDWEISGWEVSGWQISTARRDEGLTQA
jgi:hypothetical protein